MSRTDRSRSPQRQLALALPASSSGPLPRSFDLDKMELTLGGHVVKVYRFADDPEMPWFQAKPIVTFLGYSHITNTLEDHVYSEDKSALQVLIKSKGSPLGISQKTPLGYHELKAIHINEPALYSLIVGSRKEEAKEFKRWVTHEVLPSIRRTGQFTVAAHLMSETDGPPSQESLRSSVKRVREEVSLEELKLDLTTTQPKRRADDASMRDLSSPLPEALPAALPEVCLDWMKDFAVSRQELRGVKVQFKSILSIEISAGQLPQRSPVDLWTKAPPLRFREMAVGAVSSYKSLGRRYGAVAVGDAERVGRRPNEGSESDAEDDILKISEIMSTAGVWQAVWPGYRSDLANQMLSLKCAETGASFSARRPEIVQGHIHVLVHKYKKTDWPLAWTALQNTRDLYEKRVREFLEDMFRMADRPADESSLLARGIAARLRVAA